jgi:hypothetical protein
MLTQRLSKIISEHNILKGKNYAALKNNSTFEPLKIVQSIIEDANRNKKEAWILLMDISKAFDSVSSIMLEKCLRRIKLPISFINIVLDVAYNRFNQVIVGKECTEEYYVNDGIDQGETWSPLPWRIFYDPLLIYLDNIKLETGYEIELEYKEDIQKRTIKKNIVYNCTSYMDDTTVISRSKVKWSKLKANIGKYELIKINDKEKNKVLIINDIEVTKVNSSNGSRYLGFYFRHGNNRTIYVNKIKEIIEKTVKVLRWKTLTEKQITTIWNMVIIPKIEYQLLGVTLTKQECMAHINKLVKHTVPHCLKYPGSKTKYLVLNLYNTPGTTSILKVLEGFKI